MTQKKKMTLPLEILTLIFEHIEYYDYETLRSCILVNKQWHDINIPTLWRDPFVSESSTKIIISCLLVEDKDFLVENEISLAFKSSEVQQPLHNYARFATKLNLRRNLKVLTNLITNKEPYKIGVLNEKLTNFILDHSTNISRLDVTDVNCKWLINHHRFDVSFKNLYNLRCNFINGHEFFDKIANICRNIQSLDVCMYVDSKYLYTDQIDRSLTNLIKNKLNGYLFVQLKNCFSQTISRKPC